MQLWLVLIFLLQETRTGYGIRLFKDDPSCVLYLGFDRYNAENLYDDSAYGNKATLANGATISKVKGSCGVCLQILGGNVIIDGKSFTGIPATSITIAMMVNLVNKLGTHELFQTVGDHSAHKEGQYHLEAVDGKLRWFHRNEKGETVFSTMTNAEVLPQNTWVELAVMYDGSKGRAEIYADGVQVKEEDSDPMPLSQDWGLFAGIGKYLGDSELKGYIDELYIFNRTLLQEEIIGLHFRCKGPKSSQILYLNFEEVSAANLTLDKSYQANHAHLHGKVIRGINGTCGMGIGVAGGASSEIAIKGSSFRNRPTDAVTIAMWIKLDSEDGRHRLFFTSGGHSMHTHEQYDLSVVDGCIHWIHHNEYDQEIFNAKTQAIIVKGQWSHVAVTYDSVKEIAAIYVNGDIKEGSNGAGALSEDWDGEAMFGRHEGSPESFDWIDEIYMYDRELSPLEIRTMFTKCSYILTYGMRSIIPTRLKRDLEQKISRESLNQSQILYYNFDRVSGRKVYDDSGYANDGQLMNLNNLARDAGKCGHGLRFQGGNILLNGNQVVNKPQDGVSFLVWVYPDSISGQQELFQTVNPKASVNKHGQYYLELSEGLVRWFHRNDKGETIFSVETSKVVIRQETWTHIGATYDASQKKASIYINSELEKEDTGGGILSQDWSGRTSIGKFYDASDSGDWLEGRAFYGILDEIYLYNRALSRVEISSISQVCDFRRIVLYYGFASVKGNKIYDQSGLGNDGFLTNGTFMVPGICGIAVNMSAPGHVVLNGDVFRQKPLTGVSLSLWIRLNTNRGHHEIFNTIGSRSLHKHDQYHFAVLDGKIVWEHTDQEEKSVFSLTTLAVVKPRQWINLVVTYDSQESKAKAYLNGQLVKEVAGSGFLSQDWGHFVGFGKHFYENTYFLGGIDELGMYNYALPEDEILYLARGECVR